MSMSLMQRYGRLGFSMIVATLTLGGSMDSVNGADSYKKAETTAFSVEIPADWTTKQGNPDWYAAPANSKDSVSFSVRSAPFAGTLAEYVKSFKTEMQDSLNRSEILGEQPAKVAGQPASAVDTRGPCVSMGGVPDGFYTCRARCWVFVKDKIGYQIMGSANLDISKYEKTFERIVGSFVPTGK